MRRSIKSKREENAKQDHHWGAVKIAWQLEVCAQHTIGREFRKTHSFWVVTSSYIRSISLVIRSDALPDCPFLVGELSHRVVVPQVFLNIDKFDCGRFCFRHSLPS